MNCDNLLPDQVWYLGTPLIDNKGSFQGIRTDDGRTYTYIWTQESLARQFIAKCPSTDDSIQRAPIVKLIAAIICSPFEWVVVDLPENNDNALDDLSLKKLNCKRTGDVWQYISTFCSDLGVPNEFVGVVAEFAKGNPELPPLEMLNSFSALLKKNTDSLEHLTKSCREYAKMVDKDSDQIMCAALTSGFPDEPCSNCGEELWRFEELSPTAASSAWSCGYCGKRIRRRAQSGDAQEETPTRQPIPKSVQIEVWRRDKARCVECGSQEKLEFDHIIPFSRGGANTARNIQLLCESCNRIKSCKEPGT